MNKKGKQIPASVRAMITTIKILLPFVAVLILTVCLIVLAKKRWTVSLCVSLLLVGLALISKPLFASLLQKIKSRKTSGTKTKTRFAER
jgi:uncharacterized membrane protein YgdD (TMEM256/DUF423 family)